MDNRMIPDVILNEMDADELRNYVYRLERFNSILLERLSTRREIIDNLKALEIIKEKEHDQIMLCEISRNRLQNIANEMKNKYDYLLPRPTCGGNGKAGNEQ